MFANFQALGLRVLFATGLIAAISSSVSPFAIAQSTVPNEWTWMAGSSQNRQPAGAYGQLGVPAPGNTPGGRSTTISWTDTNGNFWLYGSGVDGFDGNGVAGFLDDVWEYNTSTQEWAWMAGSSTVPTSGLSGLGGGTISGAPSSFCLICAPPAVFGTYQTPAVGNTPGSLQSPVQWVDKEGNLWLFGGYEYYMVGTQTNMATLNALWEFNVSSHEWAWMGGSNALTGSTPGVYGTLGQPAAGNTPGGRTGAASWIDSSGNFWLFGGNGPDSAGNAGDLNDLWMFNPSVNQWTWMGGSSTFSAGCLNGSAACSAASVPGTLQTPAAGNIPQGRSGGSIWADKTGNFWLFGGSTQVSYDIDGAFGLEGTYINDLWKFDSNTHEWAWMSGNATPTGNAPEYGSYPGVYGTLGAPSTTISPGGRIPTITWTDSGGNLWLFGGSGFDSTTKTGDLNDLWKFDTSLNEWAWMGGSSKFTSGCTTGSIHCSQSGVYGTLGTPAAGNIPGARADAMQWIDGSGNVWFFGGWGEDSVGTWGMLNDLWKFTPATDLWTWMGGSSTVPNNGSNSDGQPGVYGSLGVQAATNIPGGRQAAASWTDSSGNFWIFGGYGCNSSNYCPGWLNDLWEYGPTAPAIQPSFFLTAAPSTIPVSVLPGIGAGSDISTITSMIRGGFNSAISLSASGLPAGVSVSFNPTSIAGASTSTMTITAGSAVAFGTYPIVVTGTSGSNSETTTVTLSVSSATPAATPTFSPPGGTYTAAQSVTIGDTTAGATIYYTTDNTTPTTSSNVYSGPIAVSSSKTIHAIAVGNGYPVSATGVATYTVNYPVTAAPTFSLASGTYASAQTVVMSDATPGATIYYTSDGTAPTAKSAVYGTPITLSSSAIIQAIAVAGSYLNSAMVTADYTIWQASATNEWAWMGGSMTPQPAVYGTLGTPALGNMPGNRENATTWTDSSGNLWLFGGDGSDSAGKNGDLNDLWKYNPTTNAWAWMGGISTLNGQPAAPGTTGTLGTPAAGNIPEGREGAVRWTDAKGNLWLFGGYAYLEQQYYSDLWRFNPSTNEWTWMGGSTNAFNQPGVYGQQGKPAAGNLPGSRMSAVSWTDKVGNLWLFGGDGLDSTGNYGSLNDLWEFNTSTSEWTWMGGSNTISGGKSSVYGKPGTPAAGNFPGSRSGASGWTDSNGNFWLFGGGGYDSAGNSGILNELWEFNPSTNQWAWMGGSNTLPASCANSIQQCGASGVYGSLQTPTAENIPGARGGAVSWTDGSGNLWLFGGDGIDSGGKWGYLDDLWEFNPSNNAWTWMSGSSMVLCASTYCGQPGVYGTYQTPAFGNTPAGRANASSWTDGKGNLWLFGGAGVNATSVWGYFEDLWEFQPGSASLPVTATPVISPASGTYATEQFVTISDPTPGATIYYLIDGVTTAAQYTTPIPVTASETIEAYAVAGGSTNSTLATATYIMNIPAAAAPAFSVASGTYATAQTVTISDTTPGATVYYTADGTAPTVNSAVYGTPITVSSSTIVQAIAVANNYLSSPIASAVYTIGSTSTLGEWAWMGGSNAVSAAGRYGTQGVAASGNGPGARSDSVRWTDKNGNLWLFGGTASLSSIGQFQDLWEFTPSTNEWAWIGGRAGSGSGTSTHGVYGTLGTPAAGNLPGARSGSASWTDSSGDLWLFGGKGYDSVGALGELNDLWRYDPPTNLWTWMGGNNKGVLSFYSSYGQPGVYGTLGVFAAGNIPGGRSNAASWIDNSGNFWLFGGTGQDIAGDSVTLNDMWEFNPSKNQWAWMGGSNFLNPDIGSMWGVYGTLGIPAPDNIPGSREQAATWTDSSGNFWLFGGSDPFGSGGGNMLNDLWKFNPSTKEWTWVSGPSTISCTNYAAATALYGGYFCGQLSVNGTLGVPASGNVPGGRAPAAQWIDSNGNLWLFGGMGLDHAGEMINDIGVDPGGDFIGPINDLWYYNPSTNLWTWMGGNVSTSGCMFDGVLGVVCGGQPGVYGTMETPAGGNMPGSRTSAVSWTDKSGNLWLFSGWGQGNSFFSDVETYPLNDVWEYRPSTATLPATPTPVFGTTPGAYDSGGPVTIFDAMPNAVIYYTTDGTTPTTASTLYSAPVTLSSSETIQAIATAPGYSNSSVASAAYVITPPAATPVFSVPAGAYTTPQTVTITDATPGATISYSTNGGTTVTQYTVPIVVSSTETLEAIATAPGFSSSAMASAAYVITTQTATPVFSVLAGTYTGPQIVTITDATPGATISYSTDGGTTMIQYTAPIVVSSTETLEAIATAPGFSSSATATAAYTISNPANPAPMIGGISPAFTSAGGAAFTLTVTGSGFTTGSTVYWGAYALTTKYGSTTQLTAQVPAANIATVGNTVGITVQTPSPGGGASNVFQFEVDSASGTATGPTFTSTTATVSAGSSASYPVTFLSSVDSVSVTCLNLPAGAACSYSATANTLTITTSSTTPKGTYQVTTVFSETVSGAATSWILFPVLLLPLMFLRRKLAVRGIWMTASIGLVLIAAAAYTVGCGGGGGGTTVTPVPQTHQVVSSGSLSITIK
jgi:N-acetylneuraminic acid mutarotase